MFDEENTFGGLSIWRCETSELCWDFPFIRWFFSDSSDGSWWDSHSRPSYLTIHKNIIILTAFVVQKSVENNPAFHICVQQKVKHKPHILPSVPLFTFVAFTVGAQRDGQNKMVFTKDLIRKWMLCLDVGSRSVIAVVHDVSDNSISVRNGERNGEVKFSCIYIFMSSRHNLLNANSRKIIFACDESILSDNNLNWIRTVNDDSISAFSTNDISIIKTFLIVYIPIYSTDQINLKMSVSFRK